MALVLPFFFFNDTATTEIYTLSLHDALPIFPDESTTGSAPGAETSCRIGSPCRICASSRRSGKGCQSCSSSPLDRKSTRLNSSHDQISYAVFCLKKKKILLYRPYGMSVCRIA